MNNFYWIYKFFSPSISLHRIVCMPSFAYFFTNSAHPCFCASFLSDYYFDYYYNIINHHDLEQNGRGRGRKRKTEKNLTTQNRHSIFGNTLLASFRLETEKRFLCIHYADTSTRSEQRREENRREAQKKECSISFPFLLHPILIRI